MDYNTPMLTEIKGNLNIRIHRDITGDRCGLGGVECEEITKSPSVSFHGANWTDKVVVADVELGGFFNL
jgi:hypothetical protein